MEIRDATEADLPAIRDLYNALIATTTVAWRDDPSTLEEQADALAFRTAHGYPTLVGPWNRNKPGAYFRLGPAFRYKAVLGRLRRERLRQMTDEALYQLAALLPENRRGHYANLTLATMDTIERVETRPGHAP